MLLMEDGWSNIKIRPCGVTGVKDLALKSQNSCNQLYIWLEIKIMDVSVFINFYSAYKYNAVQYIQYSTIRFGSNA